MKKPTMTLPEVEQALEEQNRQLQAAYEGLAHENGDRPVALPVAALERLREVCDRQSLSRNPSNPSSGIRC